MGARLISVVLAVVVLILVADAAPAQTERSVNPYNMSGPLRPLGASAALRLIIPFGTNETRSNSLLAFTAGPEWREAGTMRLARSHTVTAGLSFDGEPVLSVAGFAFLNRHHRRLNAEGSGETFPTGSAVLGIAALGGLVALLALAPGSKENGFPNVGSLAAEGLSEHITENCPGFPLVPCPPKSEE